MLEITKDNTIYTIAINGSDWGRVRKQINRSKADYIKVKQANGMFRIIVNKLVDGSTELPQDHITTYLESSIPSTASKCPVSTSRAWQHHKKEKSSSDYESVTTTWLPVKDQVEIAEQLGARKVNRTRWLSPEDADEQEWADNYKEAIRERERNTRWFLEKPDTRLDMQWYLDRQYAEDAVNDEFEKDLFEEITAAA